MCTVTKLFTIDENWNLIFIQMKVIGAAGNFKMRESRFGD
jgi:hypothetical protein